MQNPLSFCIPVSDKKTNIWCNVSCNVWLCTNGMSKHFFNSYFFSSFLVLMNAKCKCHMKMPWLVLPMRYASLNHCALICYLQTLNYWPRCQFSMNANKMWCKSRFFISDANAIFIYDAHVPCRDEMQNLFMIMLVRAFTRDANVSLQRWRCKMSCGANAF